MEFTPALVAATANEPTPLLLMDRSELRRNYSALARSLPGAEVYYAVKANPHPEVLAVLAAEGCGFEVSSWPELERVLALGVPGSRIISSNPVKRPDFVRRAFELGIDRFAFDSETELEKLAKLAPGSRVYVRLTVDNSGSEWPLSHKYGVPPERAVALLLAAPRGGLRPYGLTFHVGSQCRDPESWVRAIRTSHQVHTALAAEGQPLQMLNLGGGQPVHHLRPVPSLNEIGLRVIKTVDDLFGAQAPLLSVEPGRALVGSAGTLVTSVIGRARRESDTWVYLDAGVFNGLMETIEGFRYELRTERRGPRRPVTVAGPSCDSVDTLFTVEPLPELEVGERVYVMNSGAYTLSYASEFNGFQPPSVKLVDSLETKPAAVADQAVGSPVH
jgi:ornithine decarboxylase